MAIPVSVQLHTDPKLLGGLTISVGDEVIDASLASKLAKQKPTCRTDPPTIDRPTRKSRKTKSNGRVDHLG